MQTKDSKAIANHIYKLYGIPVWEVKSWRVPFYGWFVIVNDNLPFLISDRQLREMRDE